MLRRIRLGVPRAPALSILRDFGFVGGCSTTARAQHTPLSDCSAITHVSGSLTLANVLHAALRAAGRVSSQVVSTLIPFTKVSVMSPTTLSVWSHTPALRTSGQPMPSHVGLIG